MGKHGYQGVSHSDRAVNGMDKFIKREARKPNKNSNLPLRRKDESIPMHLWPLKDQLEYWDNMSEPDRFKRKYSFTSWYNEIAERSGMYHITFKDCVSPHSKRLQELYSECTPVNESIRILQKEKIIY